MHLKPAQPAQPSPRKSPPIWVVTGKFYHRQEVLYYAQTLPEARQIAREYRANSPGITYSVRLARSSDG